MVKVSLSLPSDEEDRVRRKLYGYQKREDCAEGDGVVPLIDCNIPAKNLVDGIVKWFKGMLRAAIFTWWTSSKTIEFDPNWSRAV